MRLSLSVPAAVLASGAGRAAGVELLLDRGADVNEVHHDEYGAMSVLYGAAGVAHDPETTRLLLEQGDLRPSDPELRDALLHARDPAIAELLIEHGAALDARDGDGLTPYSRAARFKDESMMRLLAAAGASTDLDPAAAWIGAIVRGDR